LHRVASDEWMVKDPSLICWWDKDGRCAATVPASAGYPAPGKSGPGDVKSKRLWLDIAHEQGLSIPIPSRKPTLALAA
jgi:hypothetical protein